MCYFLRYWRCIYKVRPMKNITLVFLLLLLTKTPYAETAYKLSEALAAKQVTIVVTGAVNDPLMPARDNYNAPSLQMVLTNNTGGTLSVNLDDGYMLVPADSSLQTMMVTKQMAMQLQPKQNKKYLLYAMCTEAHDGGPKPEAKFVLGKRATGNMLGLAQLINSKDYQTDAAQNAVWCLTDNYGLETISSADTAMMCALRRFVAKAKGLKPEKVYEQEQTYTLPEPTYVTRKVYSGSLSYSFNNTQKVLVALFDEDNHMKRVYVNNEQQRPGQYTYNYQIGSDEMDDKKHYLRLFWDGKLQDEIAIIP